MAHTTASPAYAAAPAAGSAFCLALAIGLALPWLMPIHTAPWTGFHADAAMAMVCALLAAGLVVRAAGSWPMTPVALCFVFLSAVPPIQFLLGQIPYLADAWLALAYLLASAMAIIVGMRFESLWPDRLVAALMGSFGLAAIVSLGFAVDQWLQLERWSAFVLSVPSGGRPVANVAQPNKLATLFLWGIVAIWWAHRRGIVRASLSVFVVAMLLFGVAMTRSRMGMLGGLLCLFVAALYSEPRQKAGTWATAIGLAGWLFLCSLSLTSLNAALQLGAPASMQERLEPGTRLLHWQLVLDAISQRPLFGWGWQQVSVAQSALASNYPASREVIAYSHNLLLDLLVWNGVPLGGLVALVIFVWFVRSWRGAKTDSHVALMLALSVFLLHSMLEMPHGYATFLLPVGLMMGAVEAIRSRGSPTVLTWQIPRAVVALILVALVSGLVVTVRDYLRIEEAWTAERLRRARIGALDPMPLPQAPTLDHLRAVLINDRIEPHAGMSTDELASMRQVSERLPGVSSLVRLARAQDLNGLSEEASKTLDRLCRTHPRHLCDAGNEAVRPASRPQP
jgi:O-antigen ligase